MEITFTFIREFLVTMYHVSPLVIYLTLQIAILGLVIGRIEKWSHIDALYFAFITATTVGYGDFRPDNNLSKAMAICIALTGVLFTGLIVAIGLQAAAVAFSGLPVTVR